MEYKQVLLVRKDLKLPKGKLAAQCAHAAVDGVMKSDKAKLKPWRAAGMKKIVLGVKDKAELYKFKQEAEQKGLVTAVITDAGLTVVASGTVTCISIGPDEEKKIDGITEKLKPL